MAEPLSVASSLVALVGFAFQTSKVLYQTVESFKTSKRAIRELRFELESLNQALGALCQAATDNEAQLDALKLPLFRCGKTCREFEELINKRVSRPESQKPSFRDWAKLQYMGGDIANLRTTLAGYKATINIAIGSATFRQTAVTTDVLEEYKQMIAEATSDLEDHFQQIDERLQSLNEDKQSYQESNVTAVVEAREEKQSTEQCLKICAQVSEVIETFRLQLPPQDHARDELAQNLTRVNLNSCQSEKDTRDILTEFKSKLSTNSNALKARLIELNGRLKDCEGNRESGDEAVDLGFIREERDSIVQCLHICADASELADKSRTNIFEDVTSADHSHQLVVSTIGDLISAKHIVTGAKSVQWLGQMSDETLQQMSRDRGSSMIQNEEPQQRSKDGFQDRYGAGYQLHSENLAQGADFAQE